MILAFISTALYTYIAHFIYSFLIFSSASTISLYYIILTEFIYLVHYSI